MQCAQDSGARGRRALRYPEYTLSHPERYINRSLLGSRFGDPGCMTSREQAVVRANLAALRQHVAALERLIRSLERTAKAEAPPPRRSRTRRVTRSG
jgi:hypothetical protein